jgi:hypothetical protein
MIDLAYMRLGELSGRIASADRAHSSTAVRLRAPRLVSALAMAEPVVAHAALNAARLSDEQWLDLIPALPIASAGRWGRDAIWARRSGRCWRVWGLVTARCRVMNRRRKRLRQRLRRFRNRFRQKPRPSRHARPVFNRHPRPWPKIRSAHWSADRSLSSGTRKQYRARNRPPRGPKKSSASQAIQSFDFASDGEGRIVWAEARVAPMVVGYGLGGNGPGANAVRLHQPFRAVPITLAGAPAIAGDWQVDAVPRFDPLGGRYIGHLGRSRRPAPPLPRPQRRR